MSCVCVWIGEETLKVWWIKHDKLYFSLSIGLSQLRAQFNDKSFLQRLLSMQRYCLVSNCFQLLFVSAEHIDMYKWVSLIWCKQFRWMSTTGADGHWQSVVGLVFGNNDRYKEAETTHCQIGGYVWPNVADQSIFIEFFPHSIVSHSNCSSPFSGRL